MVNQCFQFKVLNLLPLIEDRTQLIFLTPDESFRRLNLHQHVKTPSSNNQHSFVTSPFSPPMPDEVDLIILTILHFLSKHLKGLCNFGKINKLCTVDQTIIE